MISHKDYLIRIARDDNRKILMQPDVGYDSHFSMTVIVQRGEDIARFGVPALKAVVESPAFNEEEYIKEHRESFCRSADERYIAMGKM